MRTQNKKGYDIFSAVNIELTPGCSFKRKTKNKKASQKAMMSHFTSEENSNKKTRMILCVTKNVPKFASKSLQ